MSRLTRLAALPRRMVRAVAHNGLGNVVRFGVDLVFRHGVARSLRYAVAPDELRRSRLAEMEFEPAPARPSAAPQGDFAADGDVATELWNGIVQRAQARSATGVAGKDVVHVVVGRFEAPAVAADTDWVVLLRAGDVPSPLLSARVATAGADPWVQVVSFDMSFPGEDGRVVPVLQPGANPWLGRQADVGFGRYAFRASLLRATEGDAHARLRAWLGATGLAEAKDRWAHLFEPLVTVAMNPADVESARAEAVARGRAQLRPDGSDERVSVVICTHNRGRLLRQLVRALDDESIGEVVVIANNTTNPPAIETLAWIASRPNHQVLVRNESFNFSRFCNAGVALSSGDRLLFINDDVTPVSDDWIEPLLAPLRDPEVGVSGPLLLYPDETVQHGGIFLGYHGGAGHTLRHVRLPEEDYLFYGSVARQVSAVTGAVMMVRREIFDTLNGFDELLPTFLQDVDLCLRAAAVGQATVWTPQAELLHMESTSILALDHPAFHRQRLREKARFVARWGELIAHDPFRNPAFDLADESQRTLARS